MPNKEKESLYCGICGQRFGSCNPKAHEAYMHQFEGYENARFLGKPVKTVLYDGTVCPIVAVDEVEGEAFIIPLKNQTGARKS
jgi:hypothetical protein